MFLLLIHSSHVLQLLLHKLLYFVYKYNPDWRFTVPYGRIRISDYIMIDQRWKASRLRIQRVPKSS